MPANPASTKDPTEQTAVGKVWLVGAGPGDPGLITVRGAQLLAHADLVLHDGLVNPLLLKLAKGPCERTARIRRSGQAIVPQELINARLIHEARLGKQVVRLKGGDPYVFGRGSEEAAALHNAGIPFEVVPGITAATAAAVYAGFSCTHRQLASAVALITAHEDPEREESRLDFNALARFPGTLVFYMALARLEAVCSQLIHAGMNPNTPAAVVSQASLPSQKVIQSTLQSLHAHVAAANLRPPSLLFVGDCVLQHSQLNWFEQLPLFGLAIAIARPEEQAADNAQLVTQLGGEPLLMPLLEIQPVNDSDAHHIRQTISQLQRFKWLIWTSANGVSEFFHHLKLAGHDARSLHGLKLACVGDATAQKLSQFGLTADLVPPQSNAESLATELIRVAPRQTMLWARASRARDVLPTLLQQAGIQLEQLIVYQSLDARTLPPDILERLRNHSIHWITLTSPAAARKLAELLHSANLDPHTLAAKIASISPITTAAAQIAGLHVHAEAPSPGWPQLLQAIANARN
jgi:uroporphyrinogen III methyltransferase/synthase